MFALLLSFLSVIFLVSGEVAVLTTSNFDEFISNNEYVLVEFYAPWCGHCKRLEPEYEKAAALLAQAGSKVRLAKVDTTIETSLGERFEITGYPTMKWVRSGYFSEYTGPRTGKEIVDWVNKRSGPPSKHLTTQEEVQSFIKSASKAVIGYVSDTADWEKSASDGQVESFSFGHVTDASLIGDRAIGTVELYKDGEAEPLIHDSNLPLSKWLLQEGYPLVDELAQESWTRAMKAGDDLLAAFLPSTGAEFLAVVTAVAKEHKGKFVATQSTQIEIGKRWGASGKITPTAIYVKNEGGRPSFIIWNEETETAFTAEALSKFVSEAKEGTYKGYVKSEDIPETNDGPVTVVVGKTFDSIVRSDKNVLIEFYAPWCGHCQKLVPVYDELGKHYQSDDGVVIAKIDATANGLPSDVDVRSYPTILFFDANNRVTPFESDRDLESMRAFVESNRIPSGKQDL